MSSISATSPSPPPFNIDDFEQACIANKFVSHEQTLESRLTLGSFVISYKKKDVQSKNYYCLKAPANIAFEQAQQYFAQLREGNTSQSILREDVVNKVLQGYIEDPIETGKKGPRPGDLPHKVASFIQEQEKKQKEDYAKCKSELPPSTLATVEELSKKFTTVKDIGHTLWNFRVDSRLKDTIDKQQIEPLEAVESCAAYVHDIAIKMEPFSVVTFKLVSDGECPKERIVAITAIDNLGGWNEIWHVQPGSEFYLLYNHRIYHLKFKGLDASRKGKGITLTSPYSSWYDINTDDREVGKLRKIFEQPISKNALICCPSGQLIEIPEAMKISSLVKSSRFWEELPFKEAQEYFATLREGSDANTILPAPLVNSVLKNYMVATETSEEEVSEE